MNNLAQVCKIEEVRHHSNADRLDVVRVKGWEVIVGRDEYIVDDLIIFIQPDTLLTEDFIERYKLTYLRGSSKNRVKVIKLRGEFSHGLVIKLDILGKKLGDDLTKYFGITKWEPKEVFYTSGGKTHKNLYHKVFPKYTKIQNIKNFPNVLTVGEVVVLSEKIHGTNFRCGWVPAQRRRIFNFFMNLLGKPRYDFVVGSHNVVVSNDPNTVSYHGNNIYAEIAIQLKHTIPHGYIVYGEIYGKTQSGKTIQKNYSYGATDLQVRFFDIKYKGEYLDFEVATALMINWGLLCIPILYSGKWTPSLIEEYTCGMSILDPKTVREGFIVKPIKERRNNHVGRVIFKAISNEYLTQKKKTTERH